MSTAGSARWSAGLALAGLSAVAGAAWFYLATGAGLGAAMRGMDTAGAGMTMTQMAPGWPPGYTALFGSISGGVGFVLLRHLDIVQSPRGASGLRYQGDLLYKRSYNVGFANLSPPATQRLTEAGYFKFLRPPGPTVVHAPAHHRAMIERLYAQFGVPMEHGPAGPPGSAASR